MDLIKTKKGSAFLSDRDRGKGTWWALPTATLYHFGTMYYLKEAYIPLFFPNLKTAIVNLGSSINIQYIFFFCTLCISYVLNIGFELAFHSFFPHKKNSMLFPLYQSVTLLSEVRSVFQDRHLLLIMIQTLTLCFYNQVLLNKCLQC